MFEQLIRAFPVPRYLTGQAIGLDISDRSIKFLELVGAPEALKIGRFGTVPLPAGVLSAGEIKDGEALATALKQLVDEHGLTEAVVALPEEQSFIFDLRLPAMKSSQLRPAVELALVDFLKFPLSEAVFDFELAPMPTTTEPWLLATASVLPKAVVESYAKTLLTAGLRPIFFELEPQSLARAMLTKSDLESAVMIIDIGRARTSFYIVANGLVHYSATLESFSGTALTAAVVSKLGLSQEEAENKKITEGLNGGEKSQLREILYPLVENLLREADARRDAWQNGSEDPAVKIPITKIYLTGGQATLPGLATMLTNRLGATVVANPWPNLLKSDSGLPPLSFNEAAGYVTALGLALKNIW